eukprot:COSAG02_NODE_4487_length_5301_cov_2.865821_3_plen_105_part_00
MLRVDGHALQWKAAQARRFQFNSMVCRSGSAGVQQPAECSTDSKRFKSSERVLVGADRRHVAKEDRAPSDCRVQDRVSVMRHSFRKQDYISLPSHPRVDEQAQA